MRELISVEKAKKIISSIDIRVRVREVSLIEALHKISAEDVYSPIQIPHFPKATRDGFAVRSEDVIFASEKNPIKLKIIDRIDAGDEKSIKIGCGECVEISTGAKMPEGSDSVVMIEHTQVEDGFAFIKKAVASGENIMKRGSDIELGSLILRKGERIDVSKIGMLASAGFDKVLVKDIDIGVFSTGDELISPGETLIDAKVYDVNSYTISASLIEMGLKPKFFGILRDNVDVVKDEILKAIKLCDVIITTGGTSAGSKDVLVEALKDLGEILFHGVKVKPGKPFLLSKVNDKLIFALPGFPTSALTIFHEFVKPKLAKSLGLELIDNRVKGKLAKRVVSEGRREFMPVVVVKDRIYPVERGSGAITTLNEVSGYMEIAEGEEVIERGDLREVKVFSKVYDLAFGGLDVFDLISNLNSIKIKKFYMDSERAKLEFMKGNLDVAFIIGDEFFINYYLVKNPISSTVGAVKGYGFKADVYVENHHQLYYLFKNGVIGKALMIEPFIELFQLEGEYYGKIKIEILSKNPELKDEVVRSLEFLKC